MSDFLTLFKYEFKLQFPFGFKKGKKDFVGSFLSLLISLLIIVVFVFLISSVVENYIAVKINKVEDPIARATELLNAFYMIIIVAMSLLSVEKMRKSLTDKRDKEIFLRLPVKPQTIFLSKISVLMIINYIMAFTLVVPVNLIFYLALDLTSTFWLSTALVWLILPVVPFLIASILIIPYIKIIDFIKEKYAIIFVLLSSILIAAFMLYSELLHVVEELLETGSIKFLFNAEFTETLQMLLTYAYPANSLASIAFNTNLLESLLVSGLVVVVSAIIVYLVTKNLFYITLYKNEDRVRKFKKVTKYKTSKPTAALMKKEFISVFRDSKHIFAYFSIATAMPMMVYCCYSLFNTLIINTIGINVSFALALLVVLMFSVLTNTFCATNITRDGVAALKVKAFPVGASTVLLAKILFCSIVSSLSVILSAVVLITLSKVQIIDAAVVAVIALVFSMTQIFISTRLDLNHAKVSLSPLEVERESSKTVSKVVFIGLILSLVMGLLSVVISILATNTGDSLIPGLVIRPIYSYLVPALIAVLYFALGLVYYRVNISKSYEKLVK